jgi:hydrogenase nickel incorporation protein HypA/HybF
MHEMGIASQVVEIALASIPETHPNARVEQVNLKVGKLSAVVADSLRFCYDIIVKDTALAGSTLHIEEIPVTARCKSCDHRWQVDEPVFRCAACQSGDVKIETGQELEIESIEIMD